MPAYLSTKSSPVEVLHPVLVILELTYLLLRYRMLRHTVLDLFCSSNGSRSTTNMLSLIFSITSLQNATLLTEVCHAALLTGVCFAAVLDYTSWICSGCLVFRALLNYNLVKPSLCCLVGLLIGFFICGLLIILRSGLLARFLVDLQCCIHGSDIAMLGRFARHLLVCNILVWDPARTGSASTSLAAAC
jgi:hypothetical protein